MINVGIIGYGYWGPNYVRVFREIPNSDVSWIAELDLKKTRQFGDRNPSIKITGEYREVLKDAETDAVVISTPASTHYKIAKDCLLQDKDVLVEKPLTLKSQEAMELIKLAKERERILMVCHTFLYNAAVRKMKEYIEEGILGDLYYMDFVRTGLGPIRKDVNAMWDLASHDVSIMHYLLGSVPDRVSARGMSYVQEGIEDVVFLTLWFPNKVIVSIHVSWLNPYKVRTVTVVGSKKMMAFDDVGSDKIKLFDKGVEKQSYSTYGEFQLSLRSGDVLMPHIKMSEPLKNQCSHFIECVEKRSRPLSDGEDGLKVVKVLEAAEESLRENGKEVKIKL